MIFNPTSCEIILTSCERVDGSLICKISKYATTFAFYVCVGTVQHMSHDSRNVFDSNWLTQSNFLIDVP